MFTLTMINRKWRCLNKLTSKWLNHRINADKEELENVLLLCCVHVLVLVYSMLRCAFLMEPLVWTYTVILRGTVNSCPETREVLCLTVAEGQRSRPTFPRAPPLLPGRVGRLFSCSQWINHWNLNDHIFFSVFYFHWGVGYFVKTLIASFVFVDVETLPKTSKALILWTLHVNQDAVQLVCDWESNSRITNREIYRYFYRYSNNSCCIVAKPFKLERRSFGHGWI